MKGNDEHDTNSDDGTPQKYPGSTPVALGQRA